MVKFDCITLLHSTADIVARHFVVCQPEHVRVDLGGWCDIACSRVHFIVVAVKTIPVNPNNSYNLVLAIFRES